MGGGSIQYLQRTLDQFWQNQDIIHNYKAHRQESESRSECIN